MNKFYSLFSFFAGLLFVNNVYAQVPVLSYPSPQNFAIGKSIAPVNITNTGAQVPQGFYGQGSGIAGSGSYGYFDSNTTYLASFANPVGITMDTYGNVFVADANNNAIRKIRPDGTTTTLAGGSGTGNADGTGKAAKFNYPTGVAADRNGNVYVADFGNNSIRKITADGVVTTITKTGLNLPYGLTVAFNTDIIVADTYSNSIKRVTQAGVVTTIAGNGAPALVDGPGASASFYLPYGVVTDRAGYIYVADRNNNAIRRITSGGFVSTLVRNTNLSKPTGITMDSLGVLFVSNNRGFVSKVTTDGTSTVFAGADSLHYDGVNYWEGVDTAARYGADCGIGYDFTGNIMIADGQNFQVRRISLTGYKISPQLPAGLIFDGKATILGTPTVLSPPTNYTISGYVGKVVSTATVSITVSTTVPQTLSANGIDTVGYGSADITDFVKSTNPNIPITYTSSNIAVATIVNNAIRIVGIGTSNITASQAGDASYQPAAPLTQQLTTTKGLITVTANDQQKISGQDNPALTFTYAGFANGEDSTSITTLPVAQTIATSVSAAGDYPITVSGGVASNYNFAYVPGTLTVSPAPVITADGPTAFLVGDSVILSVSYPPGYTYQWSYNGTAIPGATASSYKATITGDYAVSIITAGRTAVSPPTAVTAAFILPAQNFRLQINATSCKGSNNGSVSIKATRNLNYTATVTDAANIVTSFNFTDTVTIRNLIPGTYNVCITVAGQIYSQCYSIKIVEPKDLSVFSNIDRILNTVNLQLYGGASYNINLNGKVYTTTQNQLSLPLINGTNKVTITTDQLCQGIFDKEIIVNDFVPYPNPFVNQLYINVGKSVAKQVHVSIFSLASGKEVYAGDCTSKAGILQMDLAALGSGLYYLNLSVDNKISSYKIMKK
jgi:sugar lactone lactonase YvrE